MPNRNPFEMTRPQPRMGEVNVTDPLFPGEEWAFSFRALSVPDQLLVRAMTREKMAAHTGKGADAEEFAAVMGPDGMPVPLTDELARMSVELSLSQTGERWSFEEWVVFSEVAGSAFMDAYLYLLDLNSGEGERLGESGAPTTEPSSEPASGARKPTRKSSTAGRSTSTL